MFHGINRPEKFVPILKEGSVRNSLPSYLKSKVFIDFRNDMRFSQSLEDLVRHIHNVPAYKPPPVGPRPSLAAKSPPSLAIGSTGDSSGVSKLYCRRCGGVTGKPSECPGYTRHDFIPVKSAGSLYCRRCGGTIGKTSKCPNYTCHDFVPVKGAGTLYCRRCGATIGKVSECPGYSSHDFVSIKDVSTLYCRRCGATIGEASVCPGYSRHDFVSAKSSNPHY
jgi:hypothetical protein